MSTQKWQSAALKKWSLALYFRSVLSIAWVPTWKHKVQFTFVLLPLPTRRLTTCWDKGCRRASSHLFIDLNCFRILLQLSCIGCYFQKALVCWTGKGNKEALQFKCHQRSSSKLKLKRGTCVLWILVFPLFCVTKIMWRVFNATGFFFFKNTAVCRMHDKINIYICGNLRLITVIWGQLNNVKVDWFSSIPPDYTSGHQF